MPAAANQNRYFLPRLLLLSAALGALFYARYRSVHPDFIVPHFCPFRELTGLPCPFCFMTRSWVVMSGGNVWDAFVMSPLGAVAFFVTIAAVIWLLAGMIFSIKPLPIEKLANKTWIWKTIVAVVLINWGYNFLHYFQLL